MAPPPAADRLRRLPGSRQGLPRARPKSRQPDAQVAQAAREVGQTGVGARLRQLPKDRDSFLARGQALLVPSQVRQQNAQRYSGLPARSGRRRPGAPRPTADGSRRPPGSRPRPPRAFPGSTAGCPRHSGTWPESCSGPSMVTCIPSICAGANDVRPWRDQHIVRRSSATTSSSVQGLLGQHIVEGYHRLRDKPIDATIEDTHERALAR